MITRLRALFRPFTYRARWRPSPRRNPDAIPFFFIDGLPVDITRDQIKALLAPYGTAVTVAIALRPQSDFLSFAFVVMATQAEADKARAALNGSHMLPHTMFRLGSSLSPRSAGSDAPKLASMPMRKRMRKPVRPRRLSSKRRWPFILTRPRSTCRVRDETCREKA